MDRLLRALLSLGLVAFVSATVFAGGFVIGHLDAERGRALPQLTVPPISPESNGGTPSNLKVTFEPFWEAWNLVHRDYVDQPVDDVQLMHGAISGMLKALGDPHTSYMDPEEYEIALSDGTGELEGIGAEVESSGDFLRIISPMPGSPAEQSGILPGDLIIKVDDTDIAGMSESHTISLVRGPAGTTVHLTIQREGQTEPLEFDIVRARIEIASVESRLLPENIAYVKVNDFGDKTTNELKSALRALMEQQPAGLVLDLRGNPGGYLDTAIEVVSQFIPEGVVMRERSGDGSEKTYEAKSGGLATDIPLVVLIDKGSASASEIVAGAIQDLERGQIVGETSYGKGSVQTWHGLEGDNGAVRVTIARWLTPDGRSIHKLGITPDVVVERTDDDRAAKRDPQLEAAIKLLTNK